MLVPSYRKGTAKRPAIGADYPTRRVHTLSLAETRIGSERNGNHSVGFRPDEWQAGTLILHARPDDVAVVTHTESERSVVAWQCANFKGHALPNIINNPHVTRCILRIDALADNPTRVIDTERREKETSVRCRLRDDRRAASAIDHAALITPGVD